MTVSAATQILEEMSVDIFKEGADPKLLVGRPFYLDFDKLKVMSNDKWKNNVGGVPSGAFLLCVYEGEPGIEEALLVRVLRPTSLPTDSDVVAAMVDYYKEAIPTSPPDGNLDSYTRAEFQFSGLECRVIGTFYREGGKTRFAGDVDNYYSPHNYTAYKPTGRVLEFIVNWNAPRLTDTVFS